MTEEAKPSSGTNLITDAMTVADSSVMKDLLGRSAKAIGDYYGEQVEEFFNKRRDRRRKNVRDHEQQVERVTGGPVNILAEGDRGGAIERWATVAADVPLEDAERAAFVEAVLAEILTSNRRSDYQDVAERLSGPSMRILLNAPSDRKFLPGGDDRGNFETLRELGLARKLDLAQFLLLLLAWCVGTAAGLYALTRILPAPRCHEWASGAPWGSTGSYRTRSVVMTRGLPRSRFRCCKERLTSAPLRATRLKGKRKAPAVR